MKILLRIPNWLGDGAMFLPIFNLIASRYKDATFYIVGSEVSIALYRYHPRVDDALIDDSRHFRVRALGISRLAAKLPSCHLSLTAQNHLYSALLLYLSGAKERIGFSGFMREVLLTRRMKRPRAKIHHVLIYSYLASMLLDDKNALCEVTDNSFVLCGLEVLSEEERDILKELKKIREDTKAPGLALNDIKEAIYGMQDDIGMHEASSEMSSEASSKDNSSDTKSSIKEMIKLAKSSNSQRAMSNKIVAIAAGASYGSAKCYENYAAVAKELIGYGYSILLLGGENERELNADIKRAVNSPLLIDLSGRTSIEGLSHVISQSHLLICNDSGPMHLASSLKTPIVAIYGPTSDIATSPWMGRGYIINLNLACAPCMKRTCPLHTSACMRGIEPTLIAKAALSVLNDIPFSAEYLSRL